MSPVLEVELAGAPLIETANNYSENTRLRIRLEYPPGHPLAGKPMIGHPQRLRIEELSSGTRVYDGRNGATALPITARTGSGEFELTLKSLASYSVNDMHYAGAEIVVVTGGQQRRLNIPQWVDADGDGKTDWLEQRVENLLRRMRASGIPEVVQVLGALQGWRESFQRDCGHFDEATPTLANISAACLDWDGGNSHRLNLHQELSATVLHEARHVWVHQNPERDPFKRRLLRIRQGPAQVLSLCLEPGASGEPCGSHMLLRDARFAGQEEDAEAFADKYKHLFP